MSSVKDYIIDSINKKESADNENIRSFFYDYYTGKEFRNPVESIVETDSTITEDDEAIISYLEEPDYGYQLMIDASKDVKGLLKSYYIPRAQPHLVSFLQEQSAYLYDLQGRWKEAISAYTYHGDRFINGLLRNTLNRYEYVLDPTEDDEYHMKKKSTFIKLINSVRNSGICPFKYSIKERYPDLRKKLENMPIMIVDENPNYTSHTTSWIEIDKPWDFRFPPLSFNINDDAAFQKIMQSSWFNSVENITPLVESLVADLLKIFIESPRPSEDIVVYRGVKTSHNKIGLNTSYDFQSTSLNPYVSINFSSYLGKNIHFMLEEITIRKNVPCIFISQYSKVGEGEWEILMPPGVRYNVENDIYIKRLPRYEELSYDTYTPNELINYMMNKKSKKDYFLVNAITAESFDTSAPMIKDIFNAARKRKALLNERRIMRHLGWTRTTRQRSYTLDRNTNRNQRRRKNQTRKQQRNKKVHYSDENE